MGLRVTFLFLSLGKYLERKIQLGNLDAERKKGIFIKHIWDILKVEGKCKIYCTIKNLGAVLEQSRPKWQVDSIFVSQQRFIEHLLFAGVLSVLQ